MRTKHFVLIFATALLVILLIPALLSAAAKASKVPPFKIVAAEMTMDNINKKPAVLIFTGDVRLTSPFNTTDISCQRLMTNAASMDNVTSVEARGDVVMSMVIVPKSKDQSTTRLDGTSQLMTYSMVDTNRVVRLVKDKNVLPKLIITDLGSKESPTMITGAMIEYNLNTRQLHVTGVEINHTGDEQP